MTKRTDCFHFVYEFLFIYRYIDIKHDVCGSASTYGKLEAQGLHECVRIWWFVLWFQRAIRLGI